MDQNVSSEICKGTSNLTALNLSDAVVDAKHFRHEEAFLGVKASRARLMNEAESRKQEVSQGNFTTKKMKTLPNDAIASSLEAVPAKVLKVQIMA